MPECTCDSGLSRLGMMRKPTCSSLLDVAGSVAHFEKNSSTTRFDLSRSDSSFDRSMADCAMAAGGDLSESSRSFITRAWNASRCGSTSMSSERHGVKQSGHSRK
eukprot:2217066-Prymnesium_polylepis.1